MNAQYLVENLIFYFIFLDQVRNGSFQSHQFLLLFFHLQNHYGGLDGGHYTAYCKNASKQRWFKFDDHEVSEISASSVKSSAAYILFYTSYEQRAVDMAT